MRSTVMQDFSVATHLACAVLFAADLYWRGLRVELMVRGAGATVDLCNATALTAFGDAAALLTPWRSGSEVARAVGARASGIPVGVTGGVLAVEMLLAYGTAAATGAWLGAAYGGEWLGSVRAPGVEGWIVALVIVALIAVTLFVARRRLPLVLKAVKDSIAAARRIPPFTLAVCVALSALSLAARVAVLPLLAMSLPDAPSFGVVALASITLLHAQGALPIPAGGGAVDYAFLNGVVGTEDNGLALLGWWRVYTVGLPIVCGLALGVAVYGRKLFQLNRYRFARS